MTRAVRLRGARAAALLALAACAAAGDARAQSDADRAAARLTATEGAKAFRDGRYVEAIDLFQRAESVVHAPPHLLFIARAQAKVGKLVSARETYQKIVRELLAPDAPAAFVNAHRDAEVEIGEIEARLPTLKVVVEGADAKRVTLTIDGVAVPSALVGLPRPIDPGPHEIAASAEGTRGDKRTTTVAERSHGEIRLVLAPAPAAVAPAPAPVVAPPSRAPRAVPAVPAETRGPLASHTANGNPAMQRAGVIVLVGGALGAGLGTLFAVQSHGKRTEVEELCPNERCSAADADTAADLQASGNALGRAAFVSFLVGGVALATGTTLLVMGTRQTPERVGLVVEPVVGLTGAGVVGRF